MKTNFRTMLAVLFVACYLVFSMPLHLAVWLVGMKFPMVKYKISHWVIQIAFNIILGISGIKPVAYGQENIPTDAPVLFVSNHKSYLDILSMQTTTKVPVGFVAKTELKRIPLLGFWMSDIGCVFLDRTSVKAAVKSTQDAVEHIKQGCSMSVCPEGTRVHTDTMKDFKDGSLKIAAKAKCLIVPVAILGTDDCLENNPGFNLTKGSPTLVYGKPIDLSTLEEEDRKHPGAYVKVKVEELYNAYKEDHMARNQK